MKQCAKKLILSSFCFILVLVGVGCKKNSDYKTTESKTSVYRKEKMKMPENRKFDHIVILDNKNILALATDSKKNIYSLISKDNGESWSEKKIEFTEEKGAKFYFIKASILESGDIAIFYTDKDTHSQKNYTIVDFNVNEVGSSTSNIKNTSNKDLFLVLENEIIQIDSKTKKEKNRYINDDIIKSYVVINNSLIVSTNQKNIKYDIETGKKVGELENLQQELKVKP